MKKGISKEMEIREVMKWQLLMTAALPFMDGEMRDFAARTLAKVERMTEAEFAGLALYPADEV